MANLFRYILYWVFGSLNLSPDSLQDKVKQPIAFIGVVVIYTLHLSLHHVVILMINTGIWR